MTVLTTLDLLADVQFIDYWDAQFSLPGSKTDIFLDDWEADVLPNDSDIDISLDDWETEFSF
jgi:hypothetical protein